MCFKPQLLTCLSNLFDPLPPSPSSTVLKFYLDAKNTQSYSGSGNTWSDLTANGNDFTLASPSWNSNGYFNLSDSGERNWYQLKLFSGAVAESSEIWILDGLPGSYKSTSPSFDSDSKDLLLRRQQIWW